MTYTASFLENPRGRKHKAPRARKGAKRRTTRRAPPKGWASWKAYMASIRPHPAGAHRKTVKSKGEHMATKRKATHRKKGAHKRRRQIGLRKLLGGKRRTRSNPPRGARRRSTGLMGSLRELPQHAMQGAVGAAEAITGKIVVRTLRAKITTQAPGTVVASAWEVLLAVFGGALLGGFNQNLGIMFTVGGLMAPGETALQAAGIPYVSSALGDDGFLVGPGTGVTLVSAHPGDYADAVRALPAAGASDIGGMADYVTGAGQSGELADYVTGAGPMGDYVQM